MPTNTLTDSQVKSIKPGEKAVKHFDGEGMHLFCSPKGAKVWRLAYRFQGKPKTMSFGAYPAVSLAEARKKRDEAKAMLRDGVDPMAPRQAAKKVATFKEACEAYWTSRGDLSPGYVENARRGLEMHLYPALGSMPFNKVGKAELLAALDVLNAQGKHSYVRKVRIWASLVFKRAVSRGEMTVNPCQQIEPKEVFGPVVVEHFKALELNEVGPFLKRLALERELQSALACKFLALTWVRTKEMRQAKWSQIDGDVWRIPAKQMKMKRDHMVPLSPQALALLKTLKNRAGVSEFIIPSLHRHDRSLSENAVTELIDRIGYKGRMTGHGWRSVQSTWANENGYRADAIERQLAHADDDKVRAAYNRAEFLDERRKMLCDWADWLDAQLED